MKKAILGTMVAGAILMSSAAQAFTIQKAVEVKAFQFNELLDRHLATEVKLWTGVDPETNKGYVQIDIDAGLKTFNLGFNEGSKELADWKHMIDKTVEWSVVAATNKVDISKYYNDFDSEKKNYDKLYNCSTSGTKCLSTFSSWSDGAKSTMHIDLEDKSNQFITFKGQIPVAEIIKLKASLDNVEQLWADRRAELADKPKGEDKTALFKQVIRG